MSSFKGSYLYSVDKKGRINLPVKLKKNISTVANDTLIITRGFEQCLYVYPADEWNKIEQNLRDLSSYIPEHRILIRTMLELAWECQLDAQARLSITQELKEFAQIENEVRIIGTLDRIELWNPKVYDEFKKSQPESYENIAAKAMTKKPLALNDE